MDLTPKTRFEESILDRQQKGEHVGLAGAGLSIGVKDKFDLISTLHRIGDDMMQAVDQITMHYMVKFFPQLKGKTRPEALDWMQRNNVLFSPYKTEHAIEGGNVMYFVAVSERFGIRSSFEVRSQVLSDVKKPGQVALKMAHRELPFPESLGALEQELRKETK